MIVLQAVLGIYTLVAVCMIIGILCDPEYFLKTYGFWFSILGVLLWPLFVFILIMEYIYGQF